VHTVGRPLARSCKEAADTGVRQVGSAYLLARVSSLQSHQTQRVWSFQDCCKSVSVSKPALQAELLRL